MYKNKIIRIQNDNDFIDLKSYSEDSNDVIKSQFITSNLFWTNYQKFMEEKFDKTQYPFSSVEQWLKGLSEYNQTSTHFPCIEDTAVKFINRNLFHNSLIPHSYEYLDLNSFLTYNISLVASELPRTDIDFGYPALDSRYLKPLPISKKEFKILRILDPIHKIFVDLKVRNLSETTLSQHVFSLPYFLRDYHLISRTRIVNGAHSNIDYNLNKHLFKFYNPSKDYLLNNQSPIVYDQSIQALQIPNSITNEFSFLHLANYLMFLRPSLFVPLTYRENKWSVHQQPDFMVSVSQASNNKPTLHLLKSSLSYIKNLEDAPLFLNDFIHKIKDSDEVFKYQDHSVEKAISQSLLFLLNENSISYIFEHSLIKAFQIISAFDNAPDDSKKY